jgi:hypothetical protein
VVVSLLVVLLLAIVAGTLALMRRSEDRSAAPLPPPAPAITGLTLDPGPRPVPDTPGGAAGTPTPPGATASTSASVPASASPSATPSAAPSTTAPTGDRTVSAPVDGLRAATFELASGTSTIALRTAAIGDDLFRITASAATRQQPKATVAGGAVRLTLTGGRGARGEVQVLLNADVRWALQVSASVSTGVFDLRGGELASVRLAGDAARMEVRTPRPDGTLPVRVTGGINRLRVQTTGATPARIRIRDGAGAVVLDGRTTEGVAPDASFTGRGYDDATDRIDVNVQAGIGSVTVQ